MSVRNGAGADRLAVGLTAAAAVMPTLLSAQGMVSVGIDVLGLAAVVALGLAVFLELALVSSALLARAAVLSGRTGSADLLATWVFSAVSGAFSATHELVGPADAAGVRGLELDAASALAAAVRIAAPLVAAWLWHRILTGDRHTSEAAPSRREARRARLLLSVATSALELQRRQDKGARRRLDRRYRTLLRHVPATDPQLDAHLSRWLSQVGRVDSLPAMLEGDRATGDTRQGDRLPVLELEDVRDTCDRGDTTGDTRQATGDTLPLELEDGGDRATVAPVALSSVSRPVSREFGQDDTRARAVAILEAARAEGLELSGADMARQLGLHTRSGQRWLNRATETLAERSA